jgi:hypothetical protein
VSRFLGAYEAFIAKATDAPVEFGHAAGLACLSTVALGRRWIDRGQGIRPNLYLLLTADSSKDRKSTSVGHAVDLLRDVEEERLAPGDFTAEGLISYMRKRKTGSKAKLLIAISEFGQYLAAAGTYGATTSATLCKLYDGESFERVRSGKKPLIIENPRVSMIGAVAYGMLEKYADPKEWITGFFARMMFVTPRTRPPRYDSPPPKPRFERDVARACLGDLRDELKRTGLKPLGVTAEADAVYSKWAKGFIQEMPDPAAMAARERLLNGVWKVAMLYQIDADPNESVSAEAMARACAFGQNCWASFLVVYGATAGDNFSRILRRAWQFISAAGPAGVSRREILRRFGANANVVLNALDVLQKMDAVALKNLPAPKGGRPSTVCVAIEPYKD